MRAGSAFSGSTVIIIGSCRNPDDDALADRLVQYAKEKNMSENVKENRNKLIEFWFNIKWIC